MEKIIGYIYYIKNNKTLKRYIGATNNLTRRIRQHLCKTRYMDKWHTDLHNNPENYTSGVLEIIETNNIEKLNLLLAERELHYYIKFKFTTGVYNLRTPSPNVQRGSKFTDDRLIKQSECHYGKLHKSKADFRLINKFINNLHVEQNL